MGPRHRTICSAPMAGAFLCLLLLLGCGPDSRLHDISDVPRGHSVILAVPAMEIYIGKTWFHEKRKSYTGMDLTFQRVGSTGKKPEYLALRGDGTNDIQSFSARPGTYRLVRAHVHLGERWGVWSMADSPYEVIVNPREAVYIGTLYLKSTFIKITNHKAKARNYYEKHFKGHGLKFIARLVRDPGSSK